MWINQGNDNHWIKIKLIGDGVSVNTTAIGAQVRINVPGLGTLTRQVEGGVGQANQNDQALHFGLGDHNDPVELEIRWPDGTVDHVTTPVDRYIQISQRGALDYDLTEDGTIDYNDIKLIADFWALSSVFDDNSVPAPNVSHWKLDSDATDSAGSNDGTIIGDPVWSQGAANSALEFDGGDYVDVRNNSSLNLTNNFTVALWLKPVNSNRAVPFCKGDVKATSSGGAYCFFSGGNGSISFYVRNSNNDGITDVSTPFVGGQWVHLAATFSNGNLTLYENGLPVDSSTLSTSTINTNTGPLAIGADGSGYESFSGIIDDVRIYDYVVSQPEIQALTNVPVELPFDLNGDSRIDFKDFAMVSSEWKSKAVEVEVIEDDEPQVPPR